MSRLETIALDLEGTLISNAVSQMPRPGLHELLEFCRRAVPRVVLFTSVPEVRCREIARLLAAEGTTPAWFVEIAYVDWSGPHKDLRYVPGASVDTTVLVDDCEAYVHPSQKTRWIPIASYAARYSDDDEELQRVREFLKQAWGCDCRGSERRS